MFSTRSMTDTSSPFSGGKVRCRRTRRRQMKKWRTHAWYALIATNIVCFSCLLKCLISLYGKQCGPRSDCSYRSSLFWVHLFASILNSSVMLDNYLQQTTSADDIFRCIFFLGALRVNSFFANCDFCHVLITFANSLDPDQD